MSDDETLDKKPIRLADLQLTKSEEPYRKSVRCRGPRFACEPAEGNSITKKRVGKFDVVEQKVSLTELKVVFGSSDHNVYVGDSVFVHSASLVTQPWAKEVFEVDGKQIILVPEDQVVLHRR